ncbi:hypothetical protein GCM10027514_42270 [Azotobacter armeniacus]
MAKQASRLKQTTRTRHSQAYKDEALALAERIGVNKAAEQLGLQPSQLYGWRSKQQQNQISSEREQRWPTRTPASSGCWPSKPRSWSS